MRQRAARMAALGAAALGLTPCRDLSPTAASVVPATGDLLAAGTSRSMRVWCLDELDGI